MKKFSLLGLFVLYKYIIQGKFELFVMEKYRISEYVKNEELPKR